MYILLEPGMRINHTDEAYQDEKWESINRFMTGEYYTDNHYPMRRKIDSLEELFESYNPTTPQKGD